MQCRQQNCRATQALCTPLMGLRGLAQALRTCFMESEWSLWTASCFALHLMEVAERLRLSNGSTISSNSLRLCDHPLGLSQHFDAHLCFECQQPQEKPSGKRWCIRPCWCILVCGVRVFVCFIAFFVVFVVYSGILCIF